jgi:hypothetical protein
MAMEKRKQNADRKFVVVWRSEIATISFHNERNSQKQHLSFRLFRCCCRCRRRRRRRRGCIIYIRRRNEFVVQFDDRSNLSVRI